MRVWKRLSDVGERLKSGYQKHFGEEDAAAARAALADEPEGPAALDPSAARRLLEIGEGAGLDEVREAYRRLARPLYVRLVRGDAPQDAETRAGSLLEALELLEEHLLPLPPFGQAANKIGSRQPRR